MSAMEPAAPLNYQGPFAEDIYREKTPGTRRKFTLHGDRLIIEGRRTFKSEFNLPISLRVVDPEYGITRRRSEIAGPGALVLGLIFASLAVLVWVDGAGTVIGGGIDATLAAVCFWAGIRNLPKVEYYKFQGRGGGIVFDIARSGPDRKRFEPFVQRVVERIRMVEEQGEAKAP
jgi:hypothetical protein